FNAPNASPPARARAAAAMIESIAPEVTGSRIAAEATTGRVRDGLLRERRHQPLVRIDRLSRPPSLRGPERVDGEMQVRRIGLRIARAAHVSDHLAALHAVAGGEALGVA